MSFAQPLGHHPLREALVGWRFVKTTGPAGDWIVFYHATATLELTQEEVITLSDRYRGVGGTGVVVVTGAHQTADKTVERHQLVAWRADGTGVDDMTEPARAATSVMAALGIIDTQGTSHHVFQTDFGILTTVYTPAYIGVDIGQWSYAAPEIAQAAGSDALVMTAGLTDPRPGLSIRLHRTHISIAVETLDELEAIDLSQQPSVEPVLEAPTCINFVVPEEPLIDSGMGQLRIRHYNDIGDNSDVASAAAAAAVAFQNWAGIRQLALWKVQTPTGEVVVQLHEHNRLSTFTTMSAVFFGNF